MVALLQREMTGSQEREEKGKEGKREEKENRAKEKDPV